MPAPTTRTRPSSRASSSSTGERCRRRTQDLLPNRRTSAVAEATKAKKTLYWGTGRRKTSVARVRIAEGSGTITINDRTLERFFTEVKDRNAVTGPLVLCDLRNRID